MFRTHPRAATALLSSVLWALLLSGCGAVSGAPVPEPSPSGSAAVGCRAVMARLPGTVDGLSRTATGTFTASWGDPAVTLRCGVPRPAGLTSTSRCDEVDGVGWYSEEFTEIWRFTTIGRSGYVEVTVPAVHSPAADALVDLAAAVSAMPEVSACR
ncbi:DUF3515 domain-containing protein [Acidipropionibacterium virtanenii]|uniref:DUF3515 domain-containing protein n=1 Tax=Acidipropionibacterium virtanenii TaxID=2057246 RepID=A0A344UTK2_9ACTN|nr:DUF3515 domain-containing protein [Acidipropionibacterium virtanenii]AXE38600.1 hypothetical protein JS278_01431 [Acidipropionibacterium virtanenii]